jgi:ribosome-binding protein aMBF1 (putative translation factor)
MSTNVSKKFDKDKELPYSFTNLRYFFREGTAMRFMDHLARRVRELRDQRGLTQYALAKAARIPQMAVRRIERGEQQGIDARYVRRLAIALHVSTDDLCGRFEDTIEDQEPAALAQVGA